MAMKGYSLDLQNWGQTDWGSLASYPGHPFFEEGLTLLAGDKDSIFWIMLIEWNSNENTAYKVQMYHVQCYSSYIISSSQPGKECRFFLNKKIHRILKDIPDL